MTWLLQHFYWGNITEKSWDFLIPIIRFQKLLRRFRLVWIVEIETILAVGHLFWSLFLCSTRDWVFDRLVSFTTEIRKITLTNKSFSVLVKRTSLIAISVRFPDITIIIIIAQTVTLLAPFYDVHLTFIKSLCSLVVSTRNSYLKLRR